jgi:PBSX family phage terminase large subunit
VRLSNSKYIDYRPYGAARELFRRRESEIILSGPAGTGKTRGLLEFAHARLEKYPGSRALMVRKTRTSLTSTALVTYEELVLPPGAAQLNYQQATYRNGSAYVFGGMDKAAKVMSSEYDLITVLEATELTENDWEALSTRLRWDHMPWQQLVADCNPAAPTHWIKSRSNAGRCTMLESRHEDNPALWDGSAWTPRGAAYIAKLDALTGARFLRLRKGIWAASEGMVYDTWDPAVHLIDRFEPPKDWLRIWVVDFGYTNPFVWQAWARDHDGRLYRYAEIYRTQRLVQDHAADMIAAMKNDRKPIAIICDHDAEDRGTLERYLGMSTGAAFKSVQPGIQAVQSRLRKAGDGRPRIFLMRDSLVQRDEALVDTRKPVCTEEEIEAYVWPQSGSGKNLDQPVKRDDHGMDAMRYLVAFADDLALTQPAPRRVVYHDPVEISPY